MDQEQQTAPAAQPIPASTGKSGGGSGKVILIIVIILIVLLGGGYVAYAKLIKKANSLGQILSPSAIKLNPDCKYNDPDLCKFMNNWSDSKEMTMISEGVDKDGVKSKLTMKTKGTDKSQMIAEENGKENMNYITIGKTSYSKDYSDNKWFKYTYEPAKDPVKTEESKIDFSSNDNANVAEDKTTYKKIGTEACDKLTCFKYQVIDPDSTDSIEYIYFDNKEYLLRKTRSEYKDGSVNESTFNYSSVSISEPSPTKEGNPYSASTPSSQQIQDELNKLNASTSTSSSTSTANNSESTSSSTVETPAPASTSDTSSQSTYDSSTDLPLEEAPIE